jgi:hypothetical protein
MLLGDSVKVPVTKRQEQKVFFQGEDLGRAVGNPDYTSFTYRLKYKGHGTGINLRYHLQPKKSPSRNIL